MLIKILYFVGLAACVTLLIACFLPWAYYADLQDTFTGMYSYHNQYGKPGKFLAFIAVIVFIFMLLPKIWATRINLFVCALGVGYAIKSYILFTSCYNAYCPEKKIGIFLILFATIIMLLASIFPDMKLKKEQGKSN